MTSRELFEKAIEVVLEHEGGEFTDDPRDKGGATKFGIAQRWNPDVDVKSLTRSQAIVIYWDRYWKGRRYEELPEQVAIKVFDLAVNLGHKTAVSCLQRALFACGMQVGIDGRLGPQTIGAVRLTGQRELLASLRSEAAGEYRIRVKNDATQAAFENGWLARAYS
jgi:lysozyme family protein